MMDLPLKIRQAKPDELHLVTDCWIKNVRANEPWKNMDYKILSREYFPVIQNLLEQSQTIVATHEEEDDEILSFSVMQKKPGYFVVHFVYTKKPYRKLGIAKHLFNETLYAQQSDEPIFFTHFDWFGHKCRKKGWIYNPFLIWKL